MTAEPPKWGRKTVYKGIEMRSRLEAAYARWLDARRWKWTYETQAFASDLGQYFPDFRIENVHNLVEDTKSHAYVEIKPTFAAIDAEAVFRRMEIIWDSEPDAQLLIQVGPEAPELVPESRVLATRLGHTIAPFVFWRMRTVNSSGEEFRNTAHLTWMIALDGQPALGAPMTEGPWPHGYWEAAG
jgi:hypothetical protein